MPVFTDEWYVEPFLIVGAVLAAFSVAIVLFAVEICLRLQKNAKRVKDPEIDNIDNLHQIKHWVEPGMQPENNVIT